MAIAAIATIAVASVTAIVATAGAASAVVGAVATTYGTAFFGVAAGEIIGTAATYATAAAAATAASFITVSASSDITEVITGENCVCDTLFSGNRTNYEFCKGLSYVVATGISELGRQNWSLDTSPSKDVERTKNYYFKDEKACLEHYNNHYKQVSDVLECDPQDYSIERYLDDANYIIENGTYSSELNGYIKFIKGDKYGFVGLNRETGNITTFHIKTFDIISRKAPSLGFRR